MKRIANGRNNSNNVTGKESARGATICGEKTIEEIENDSRCEQKKIKNDKTGEGGGKSVVAAKERTECAGDDH